MRFRQLFLLTLALVSVGSSALAKDKEANSASQAASADSAAIRLEAVPDFSPQTGMPNPPTRLQFSQIDRGIPHMNDGICYTMRTYMVKATERLIDNESGFRGYSSCQTASTYNLRSAESQDEAGANWK
jgi:hypothetical protein